MKTSTIVSTIAILLFAAGAWYFLSQESGESLPFAAGIKGLANKGNTGQPMADGAEGSIIGANLALGLDGAVGKQHLIGYNGMTLYTKDGDTSITSSCIGQCLVTWPPYLVGAEDNVHNVKAEVNGKVDTFIRADGKIQVAYNGKPLYFYSSDKSGSDTTGDGVGGVWHVAKP